MTDYKDKKTQAEQAKLRGSGPVKMTTPDVAVTKVQPTQNDKSKVVAENAANTRKARTWRPVGYADVKSKADTTPEKHTVPQTGFGSGYGYDDPTGKKYAGSKGYKKL